MAGKVIVLCEGEQMERLEQMALRLGLTPPEAGAMLIEEGLREAEFRYVEFRESPVGRQAYVRGSRLAVWEVMMIAQSYAMEVARTAEHFQWPAVRVQGVFDYAAAFPHEIQQALHKHDTFDFEALKAILPHAELFHASDDEQPMPAVLGPTESA
jgi:hypothetical protein